MAVLQFSKKPTDAGIDTFGKFDNHNPLVIHDLKAHLHKTTKNVECYMQLKVNVLSDRIFTLTSIGFQSG